MNCPGKILRVYSPTGWQTTSEDGVFLPTSVARAGFKISIVRLLFWNLEIAKKENKLKKGFRIFTQNHYQELQNVPPLLAPLALSYLQHPFRASLWIWSGLSLPKQVGWKFAGKKPVFFPFFKLCRKKAKKVGRIPIDSSDAFLIKIVNSPQFWVRIESAKLRCKKQKQCHVSTTAVTKSHLTICLQTFGSRLQGFGKIVISFLILSLWDLTISNKLQWTRNGSPFGTSGTIFKFGQIAQNVK